MLLSRLQVDLSGTSVSDEGVAEFIGLVPMLSSLRLLKTKAGDQTKAQLEARGSVVQAVFI
jgi:hypothetical protein